MEKSRANSYTHITTKYTRKRSEMMMMMTTTMKTKKNAFVRLTSFPDTYPMTRFIRKRKKCQHKIWLAV